MLSRSLTSRTWTKLPDDRCRFAPIHLCISAEFLRNIKDSSRRTIALSVRTMDSSVRAMKRVRMDSKLATFSATAWVRCASVAMGRQGHCEANCSPLMRGWIVPFAAVLLAPLCRRATARRRKRSAAACPCLSPGRRDSRWRPALEGGSQSGWGVASSAASTWCLSRRNAASSIPVAASTVDQGTSRPRNPSMMSTLPLNSPSRRAF